MNEPKSPDQAIPAAKKPKAAKSAAAPSPAAKGKPKAASNGPAATPPPQARSAPEPAIQTAPEPAAAPKLRDDLAILQNFESFEKLSSNLWEASVRMQKIAAEAVALAPPKGADMQRDPFGAQAAFTEVLTHTAADPASLIGAQTDLFRGTMKIWTEAYRTLLQGPDLSAPDPTARDRRFTDPDWRQNVIFDILRRTYLFQSEWLQKLAANAPGVDDATRNKASFFMKQAADAFSPSNFLFTNPTVLKKTMETGGENLLRGLDMLEEDLKRGKGRLALRQTDSSQFEIGRNIATSRGKVIFRNEVLELIQYDPVTPTVAKTPILFFPPWINKFYILDMREDNSMVRWQLEQGRTVFVTSWVNPSPSLAKMTFDDYMKLGILGALGAVQEQTGEDKVHIVGYCIAGTLLGSTLAYMAATGDDRVASATFFAAQLDFEFAGDLLFFSDKKAINYIETKMDEAGGVLEGQVMSETFNALRAPDLYWSYIVSNYLLGEKPRAFDLLFWNDDQTRMPRTLHLFYLRNFYGDNKLSKGEISIGDVPLDLSKVKVPVFVQAARDDHIAPAKSVYKSARLLGHNAKFTLAGSGHIAGVINHPSANKYQHWVSDDLPPTFDAWKEGATEHPGSWWTGWSEWLKQYDGPQVPSRDPAKGPLKPLCDAPGTYVLVRSDEGWDAKKN